MSSRKRLILSGTAALALALVILASGILSGSLPLNQIPGSSSPTGGTQPGSNSASGFGTLSVLLTDPPRIPSGISAVYVSYSGISLHQFGSGSPGTWVNLSSSGTVEVLSLVNKSVTISVQRVPSGSYDQVSLMITMVRATYSGVNLTLFSGSQQVIAQIPGGINVYMTAKAALLFDLQSSILNLNSDSSPKFVFNAAAWSAQLPVDVQKSLNEGEGQVINLSSEAWWSELESTFASRIAIVGATLTSDSLSVTVKNTGNEMVLLDFVTVTPLQQPQPNPIVKIPDLIGIPIGNSSNLTVDFENMPAFSGASVFAVLSNGSLVPISSANIASAVAGTSIEPYSSLNPHFYPLRPGDEVTLSYTGPVYVFTGYQGGVTTEPITSLANSFIITVIGNTAVAATLVNSG
ncbi:MAG: DUF4382 domain-containing protein [Nitrososphaerota archaeon]|jgi:hypothetical protein|nr:DUF4382 domain-containing protein [Nitrososphaerota archaeon]